MYSPTKKMSGVGDFISLVDYFKEWQNKHANPNNPKQLCNWLCKWE